MNSPKALLAKPFIDTPYSGTSPSYYQAYISHLYHYRYYCYISNLVKFSLAIWLVVVNWPGGLFLVHYGFVH